MRKIVLTASVSLDGYMSGPNGEIDWHMVDDELHAEMNRSFAGASVFLDGKVSYELMADFWPTADQDPDAAPVIVEFARLWRAMPKIVWSRTLTEVGWNSTLRREFVPEEIRALQAQPGGDMVIGPGILASTFMDHDLVDEYWLNVNPIILGIGQPVFRSPDRLPLELIDTRTFGNGVVRVRHRRVR